MITAGQLIAHGVGDYLLQSDWMATEKTSCSLAAAAHALSYSVPFLVFAPTPSALAFIVVTHFVIDRWRLARYVVWARNFLAPPSRRPPPFRDCAATGSAPDRPAWLATLLLIIADNILHALCNGIALRWL